MIAPSSVQEVLSRTDIVDVLGQFIRLRKRGSNYIANCPFHNEKTPSFNVSPARGIYKCFGCGKSGNTVTFLQEHEHLSFPEAIRWLADHYKISIEESERSPEQKAQLQVEESLRILNEFAAGWFEENLMTEEGNAIGRSYFEQRGFNEATIRKFRLGYSPEAWEALFDAAVKKGYSTSLLERSGLVKERNGKHYDAFRGRVIFPIQGTTGRVLGFGGRILKSNDKAPKYINSPETELYVKSRVLYGMYQSRTAIGKLDECLLVEGYTDVISLHQSGVENVVASSGTSLTEDQLRLIGQVTRNLVILYDGDAAGIKAALRGLDMALSQSFNVQVVLLPPGQDPDSLAQESGAEAFRAYIAQHKQDVISFQLQIGLNEAQTDPVRKSKLVQEIAESISRISKAEDFSLQEHFVRLAATRLDVTEEGMVNLVNKFIRDRIEGDQKQRQREKPAPEPLTEEEAAETLHQAAPVKNPTEEQEWELIRVLVEYGHMPLEGFNNVAEYIASRIDAGLIDSPQPKQLFEEYFRYWTKQGQTPELSHFTHFPDPQVQQKIASLLQSRLEISPNWKIVYGIESLHEGLSYPSEVESMMYYFELKKLRATLVELTDMLKTERDEARVMFLMEKYVQMKKDEATIADKMGTVIFKATIK